MKYSMTLQEALDAVIKNCPNPYAKSYAQAMPQAISEYGEEGQRVQCLYILSNIVDVDPEDDPDYVWDTEEAKEVIEVLKEHSKK